MAVIPTAIQALERDLQGIFGPRLQSLVVYGLRAGRPSQTRTMVVVDAIGGSDLRACAARVRAWHAADLATPLLVAAHEFDRSLDVFPLEFGAILADHTVVSGANPFEGLKVEPADVRRACELQARSHLLHLREGFMEAAGNGDALAVLVVQSAAPFAALLTSLARFEGRADSDAASSARHAERLLGVPPNAMTGVVQLAHAREISASHAEQLFPAYLDAVQRLVTYVDGWSAA